MDRRKALKNISLAIGGIAITPSVLSILTSCTNEKVDENYLFLNQKQQYIVHQLMNVILPIPNFKDKINYTLFIDKMFHHTVSKENQELFNLGYLEFEKNYQNSFKKETSEANKKDIEKIVKNYFSISKQKEEAIFNLLAQEFSLIDKKLQPEYLNYTFLTKVRYYALLGYCTSEYYNKPL
ncbi:hypothetical protein CW731_13175 [Polaribacter sp. ALD11]|uniref:gluconate 2-dehydrogenase subunit 3 family protein n=1 Tax=Polaribacter sp. ALD11 TaxID=2058137 RepID=UPI000C315C41|nr:gluconate 2-dehydrogenase subunit 3 family protein [Polaribacter sp. ALD11]AUC86172.1 hypothetical protein CW731_13175 [Polaribacter sp. ALD11]